MQLIPYINFNGRCRDALAFYAECFGQAEVSIQSFADMPADGAECNTEEVNRENVMHAEFKSGGLFFMATDGQPSVPFNQGNNIHLSIALDSEDEQTRIFDALAEGGHVVMPLQNTFWQSRFGMVTDEFGIQWMLNVTHRS